VCACWILQGFLLHTDPLTTLLLWLRVARYAVTRVATARARGACSSTPDSHPGPTVPLGPRLVICRSPLESPVTTARRACSCCNPLTNTLHPPPTHTLSLRHGCEREACLQLLQKVYNMHERGKHLEIKSAVCLDHLKGFIYVEAAKDSHVSFVALVMLAVTICWCVCVVRCVQSVLLYTPLEQTSNPRAFHTPPHTPTHTNTHTNTHQPTRCWRRSVACARCG
jgi:hypothetical protein